MAHKDARSQKQGSKAHYTNHSRPLTSNQAGHKSSTKGGSHGGAANYASTGHN